MNLAQITTQRYTTKAFDASKSIPQATIDELLTLLRNVPSSVNSQPSHFIVASTAEGKARLAKGALGAFPNNEPKVLNASHVIVLCTRTAMSDAHLDTILKQEEQDGRFSTDTAKSGQQQIRSHFVNLHRYDQKDLQHWMEKQTYLALGSLLLGAAALGIDATPMEGFDAKSLDAELNLHEQGLTSVVIACLGYRSDSDFNAALPKSRLPQDYLFTHLA
ncbi:oxygen-insensitive NAD(P)H-dependent nitroreductase NfsB [Pseudomonas gingeri NCPPB 3146 = LMG 5327]|uniref:Oxygen-insensitive NAD(P)H-dependent nitroreductase NfsB n=2 Tax=Pseudomonas gingeri TaxID=117681 RepID=A0A7Y8CGP6_9PSED|nr:MULTISPECIES: oxygen-insensitive NAD(P)H-dependent nitroreductase NfsB [Pseudomonas]NVZ27723.1 oxygen-insensitive NAD(P)H-dependent nitroreductase NfsB [Pseudomonas gingeri]NWC17547.1 oxygen-insensitive NAD(P)H-dependent nitroreductase NfsB [Pseudomonas gingeri]NWE46599.1 oxygen-insensitive NAD(P)H-dependent nitroreductase NfsB [Pseudomonas gingeri]NWE70461.1 oxygen-insensitive NAD(P)H-dependent nitroreductase NfsB [Pseudomonas gingeri]PNQ88145.1 oxygen-insensitive NAD(P)H-dependent nitrore